MGKKEGKFQEIRTMQIDGRKIEFLIYQEPFGLKRFLQDIGGAMEVIEETEEKSRFIFTFYHRTNGLLGWLINPIVKKQQKKNREAALLALKNYTENISNLNNRL